MAWRVEWDPTGAREVPLGARDPSHAPRTARSGWDGVPQGPMAHRNEGLDDGTTMPYLSSPREVQHISRGGRPDANNGPVEANQCGRLPRGLSNQGCRPSAGGSAGGAVPAAAAAAIAVAAAVAAAASTGDADHGQSATGWRRCHRRRQHCRRCQSLRVMGVASRRRGAPTLHVAVRRQECGVRCWRRTLIVLGVHLMVRIHAAGALLASPAVAPPVLRATRSREERE